MGKLIFGRITTNFSEKQGLQGTRYVQAIKPTTPASALSTLLIAYKTDIAHNNHDKKKVYKYQLALYSYSVPLTNPGPKLRRRF